MHPIFILLFAIASVFLLIIRWKINAFVALILSAILIGLLSPEVLLPDIMAEVTGAFGGLVGRIGIAIAMAAVIGQCLMESGAAEKITRRFIAWLGEKYSSLSMVISGYVLSIPVFHDTVFYLLVPLARSMSMRTGGKHYLLYTLAIGAGGVTTHIFVPPTPNGIRLTVKQHSFKGSRGIPAQRAGFSRFRLWLQLWLPCQTSICWRVSGRGAGRSGSGAVAGGTRRCRRGSVRRSCPAWRRAPRTALPSAAPRCAGCS